MNLPLKKVVSTTRFIATELRKIPELELMAEADVSVVAFTSKHFNIMRLMDDMAARGWSLNALQYPAGIHIAVTKMHTKAGVAERFVKDIRDSVNEIMKLKDRKLGKLAAIYCSTQAVPDKSLINDVTYMFLDACYNTSDGPSAVNGAVKNGKFE